MSSNSLRLWQPGGGGGGTAETCWAPGLRPSHIWGALGPAGALSLHFFPPFNLTPLLGETRSTSCSETCAYRVVPEPGDRPRFKRMSHRAGTGQQVALPHDNMLLDDSHLCIEMRPCRNVCPGPHSLRQPCQVPLLRSNGYGTATGGSLSPAPGSLCAGRAHSKHTIQWSY